MAKIELDGRIGHKRDTDAALTQSGFVPLDGELVLAELDGEVRLKAGDGVRTYAELPFLDAVLREEIEGKADADHTHAEATERTGGFISPTDKEKLDGIEANANNYSHPTYFMRDSDLYKIRVNNLGHVAGATKVTKEDITALGIPGENTTYELATSSSDGLMSSADKFRLYSFFQWKINPLTPAGQGSVTVPRNTTAYFGEYTVEQSGLYYLWYQTWAQPGEYNKTFVLFLDSAENGEMAVRGEATSNVTVMCVAGVFSLSAGDTIKGRIFHNCTNSQSVGTKFGVLLLTAA